MTKFLEIHQKVAHLGVVCAMRSVFFDKLFAHLNKNLFLCTRFLNIREYY